MVFFIEFIFTIVFYFMNDIDSLRKTCYINCIKFNFADCERMININTINSEELLKLDNQLCFSLYACSREIIKKYRPHLEKLNLTYTQYITMMVLWEEGSMSVKELGERLFLDSGTLTPLLKKLEAAGLLERKRSSKDERILIVSITQKGMELKEKAKSIPESLMCAMDISMEELVELRDKIKNLTANLTK